MRDEFDPYKPVYDRRRRPARTGRVGLDSVGNPYWQDAGEQSDPWGLENRDLALAADDTLPKDAVENRSGTVSGYNPYGSGLLIRKESKERRPDLRALSDWINSKRRAAENQD